MSYTIRHATEEGIPTPHNAQVRAVHFRRKFSPLSILPLFTLSFTSAASRISILDVPVILQLVKELAEYENCLQDVVATTDSLRATLSFPSSSSETGWTPGYAKAFVIVPSLGEITDDTGKPVVAGMALYFHNYSTWTAAPGIYLEDLIVRGNFRGKGYGKALLAELARECLRLGCKRLDWSVLKWNKPSIDLYLSDFVGGTVTEDWQGIRVEGMRLESLANRGRGDASVQQHVESYETNSREPGSP